MSNRDEHVQMIEDCEARESKLTDWEANFIDSIKRQLEDPGYRLSLKQEEILDRIWNKVT